MTNVIVAGASRGIGAELVRQHLAAGDRVFAMMRNPGDAENGGADIVPLDVASDASAAAAAEAVGDVRIDILYLVAGISGKTEPMLEPGDWDSFDEAIEIMVKGPLRMLRAMLPKLDEGSKVIAFSSQLAASTWPYGGYYPYVAAKAALNRLFRSVAIDLKDRGIVVGTIHPGWVQTDIGGPDADITPAESARAIRALAAGWTLDRSGDFLKWSGEPHPW